MGKSLLTIEKEILKKEYQQSPLGKVEKELNKFYDMMKLTHKALPEDIAEKIYDIREENENRVNKYVEDRLKHDREAVDNFLLDAMTRELEIIRKHNDK